MISLTTVRGVSRPALERLALTHFHVRHVVVGQYAVYVAIIVTHTEKTMERW